MQKSEDNLIAWIAARYPPDDVPIGIGDDMVMLPTNPAGILVTCDMLMDGVDFDTAVHQPERIGRKALAVSLSDCAAMAVRPRWVLVSVALPDAWSMEKAQRLYLGMEALAWQFDVRIVGGDTNSWDKPLVIDVTIIAEPWPGLTPVRRGGLKSGDAIYVTGLLGGSLAGHHLDFAPRVEESRRLAVHFGSAIHAMMDLSDGLSVDAGRMAMASNCGMEFEESAIHRVVSEAAREASRRDGRSELDHAMNDGEDFELLFAVDDTRALDDAHSVRCTRIGRAIRDTGVWLIRENGSRETVQPRGWRHFTDK